MKWVTVKEIAVNDNEGTYRVRRNTCHRSIVIERLEEEWVDITDECTPKLVTSCRSIDDAEGSKYLALYYNGGVIAIYKPDGTLVIKSPSRFKIVKGRCATYSFNVFVKIE